MTLIRVKFKYQTQRAMYVNMARECLESAAHYRQQGDRHGARTCYASAQRARKRAQVMGECIRDIDDFMTA